MAPKTARTPPQLPCSRQVIISLQTLAFLFFFFFFLLRSIIPALPPSPYSCANSGTRSLVTCPPNSCLFLICTSGDK